MNNFDFLSAGVMAVSVVSFTTVICGLVTQHTLSQMGNRGYCVTRPNNICKGDNSKYGSDAFHFNADVFRQ